MPRLIPLSSGLPHFTLQVRLEDVTYTVVLKWNVRAAAWFMDVLDAAAQVVIRCGSRVVVDFPVYPWGHRLPVFDPATGLEVVKPPGSIFFLDSTGNHRDPDFDAIGATALQIYYTAAELAG